MSNTHFTTNIIRPLVPAIVEFGGPPLHLTPAKPLPKVSVKLKISIIKIIAKNPNLFKTHLLAPRTWDKKKTTTHSVTQFPTPITLSEPSISGFTAISGPSRGRGDIL